MFTVADKEAGSKGSGDMVHVFFRLSVETGALGGATFVTVKILPLESSAF